MATTRARWRREIGESTPSPAPNARNKRNGYNLAGETGYNTSISADKGHVTITHPECMDPDRPGSWNANPSSVFRTHHQLVAYLGLQDYDKLETMFRRYEGVLEPFKQDYKDKFGCGNTNVNYQSFLDALECVPDDRTTISSTSLPLSSTLLERKLRVLESESKKKNMRYCFQLAILALKVLLHSENVNPFELYSPVLWLRPKRTTTIKFNSETYWRALCFIFQYYKYKEDGFLGKTQDIKPMNWYSAPASDCPEDESDTDMDDFEHENVGNSATGEDPSTIQDNNMGINDTSRVIDNPDTPSTLTEEASSDEMMATAMELDTSQAAEENPMAPSTLSNILRRKIRVDGSTQTHPRPQHNVPSWENNTGRRRPVITDAKRRWRYSLAERAVRARIEGETRQANLEGTESYASATATNAQSNGFVASTNSRELVMSSVSRIWFRSEQRTEFLTSLENEEQVQVERAMESARYYLTLLHTEKVSEDPQGLFLRLRVILIGKYRGLDRVRFAQQGTTEIACLLEAFTAVSKDIVSQLRYEQEQDPYWGPLYARARLLVRWYETPDELVSATIDECGQILEDVNYWENVADGHDILACDTITVDCQSMRTIIEQSVREKRRE